MFLFSQKIKKSVLILLIISLVSIGVTFPSTKKAEATGIPVVDLLANTISTAIHWLTSQTIGGTSPLYTGVAWAGRQAMKMVLHRMTLSIVEWIDNGFNGNPGFIDNPGQFLKDTADITIGDMIMNDESLNFLCDPFKLQIKLSLGLQYQPFKEEIRCRFTDVLNNTQDAYNNFVSGDFINNGGWESWLSITTVPQNNQMGAMIIAQNELDVRIKGSRDIELAKANWSGGFLSWEKCTDKATGEVSTGSLGTINADASHVHNTVRDDGGIVSNIKGVSNTDCQIMTPGKEIVDQLGWAQSSTIRELEISNDLDAIFNALAHMAIKYGADYFSSVVGGSTTESSAGTSPYDNYQAYLRDVQTQYDSSNSLTSGVQSNSGSNSNNTFSQSFSNQNAAIEAIRSQISIENDFRLAQNNLLSILSKTQTAFENSSCSETVKTDTIDQITGGFVGVKNLIWNKQNISDAMNINTVNLSILNSTLGAITSASSNTDMNSLTQRFLGTLTLNTPSSVSNYSVGGNTFNQVRSWIVSKLDNNSCVSATPAGLGLQ